MENRILIEKNINNYQCKLFRTNNIETNIIDDFLSVHNVVFPGAINKTLFKRKYTNNIYGDSFIVIVYCEGKPISIDAMWRNDINGETAYQSCDTATLEEHRGKGIFKHVTNMFIEVIGDQDIIYGYPNTRSYPGYMKMGWKSYNSYNFIIKLMNYNKELSSLDHIENNYAEWWLSGSDNPNLRYVKRGNRYYLASKKKSGVYIILGKIDESIITKYQRGWPIIWIFLSKNKKSYLLKKLSSINVITYLDYKNSEQITSIKTDVIP